MEALGLDEQHRDPRLHPRKPHDSQGARGVAGVSGWRAKSWNNSKDIWWGKNFMARLNKVTPLDPYLRVRIFLPPIGRGRQPTPFETVLVIPPLIGSGHPGYGLAAAAGHRADFAGCHLVGHLEPAERDHHQRRPLSRDGAVYPGRVRRPGRAGTEDVPCED